MDVRKTALLAMLALAVAFVVVGCADGAKAKVNVLKFGNYELEYPKSWGEPSEYARDFYFNTDAQEFRWKMSEVQSVMVVDVSGNGVYSGDFLAKVRGNHNDGETEFVEVGGKTATSTWFTYDGVYREKVVFGYENAELTFIVTMKGTDLPSSDDWKEMDAMVASVRRAS